MSLREASLPSRPAGSSEPGTLSDEEYAQVTAYLLRLNGMPDGSLDLPADSAALGTIRIVPLGYGLTLTETLAPHAGQVRRQVDRRPDVFADRRIPAPHNQDPILLGECLGGGGLAAGSEELAVLLVE